MKRCFAIICAFLLMAQTFALATQEPMPYDAPVTAEGVDMLAVDHRLYELGYRDAECDGELDEVTINALKKFQIVNGLTVTGDADEQTVALLLSDRAVSQIEYLSQMAYEYANAEALQNGSYGDRVTMLQRALQKYGYFSGKCDGAYGDATEASVRLFQMANGLSESGIADGAVFMRLYEGTPIQWEEFLQLHCASVGDSGDHVRLIQLCLKNLGHFAGECTGRYGEGTQQAVRNFQMERGIEASGDVDMDTSRALFSISNASISGANVLSRGSTDERIDALCIRLNELGYGAHAMFDLQTELALMKYQYVNGLHVSGSADEALIGHINGEKVLSMEEYQYIAQQIDADGLGRIARKATAMLGQMTKLDDKWSFVEYLLLSCGYAPARAEDMNFVEADAEMKAEAGSIMRVELNGQEIFGVAAMDGAVIYQGDEGYVIVGYLDMLEADRVYVAGLEAQDAA